MKLSGSIAKLAEAAVAQHKRKRAAKKTSKKTAKKKRSVVRAAPAKKRRKKTATKRTVTRATAPVAKKTAKKKRSVVRAAPAKKRRKKTGRRGGKAETLHGSAMAKVGGRWEKVTLEKRMPNGTLGVRLSDGAYRLISERSLA
ncbi:MAG: hypothetical protein A2V70_01260 [Planctomycetes bacterium RBG_13_63_9]|nr:MAG: hypothetical protein A2V70_01260 [Planctomycetes bacterium RBG_13_63_9]